MVSIIDYGVGNLTSILNMFKKAGAEVLITGSESDILKASKILLPGMGHFDNCMEKLNASGLRGALEQKAVTEKIPVLGICVGLQMFMHASEEGTQPGLGWIPGKTIRFKKENMLAGDKIPNMGWLEIKVEKPSRLTEHLDDARFYFAHSFHVQVQNEADALITADYGYNFTAGIEKNNLLGVQFHPEKSHRFGMQLLKNFAFNY
ncbi:MAG: imidazole glycerol phosphate synthase subunit HisH [Bacteroidota bacterium]